MKQVVVKIHNKTQTVLSKTMKIGDQQATIIQAIENVNYELINVETGFAPDHIITKRIDQDLHISFDQDIEQSEIIIKDFYLTDDSSLIGMSELNDYHYYTPDTGNINDYVTQLYSNNIASGHALGSNAMESAWWAGITRDNQIDAEYTASKANTLPPNKISTTETTTDTARLATETLSDTTPLSNTVTHAKNDEMLKDDSHSVNTTDWTPWAIGAASIIGVGIALAGGGGSDDNQTSNNPDNSPSTIADSNASNDSSSTTVASVFTTPDNHTNSENSQVNKIIGDDENNILTGTADNDFINGGLGNDVLTGNNGHDIFCFSDLLDGSIDRITDFNAEQDKIQLSSEVFTALHSETVNHLFDYINYDTQTGQLSYIVDGHSNSAIHFADLPIGLELSEQNFIII